MRLECAPPCDSPCEDQTPRTRRSYTTVATTANGPRMPAELTGHHDTDQA
jgi:hypothetical protein